MPGVFLCICSGYMNFGQEFAMELRKHLRHIFRISLNKGIELTLSVCPCFCVSVVTQFYFLYCCTLYISRNRPIYRLAVMQNIGWFLLFFMILHLKYTTSNFFYTYKMQGYKTFSMPRVAFSPRFFYSFALFIETFKKLWAKERVNIS